MYDTDRTEILTTAERTPEEIARLQAIFDQATGTTAEQRAQNAPEGGETVSEAFTPPPAQSRPELTDGVTDADFEAMPEDKPAPDTPPDYYPEDTEDDCPEDLPGDRAQTGSDLPAPRNMKPLPKKIKSADNLPFVQMPHCITVSDMTDAEYRLYGLLLKYHTMRRGINVSVSQMARDLGKKNRCIKSILSSLETKGYIKREFVQGKNTKIMLFYPESSAEKCTPTGAEKCTPTGAEKCTPTGAEKCTHNKNEYNKNESNNIQVHSQACTRAHERENIPEDTKPEYKVLIDFDPTRKGWEKDNDHPFIEDAYDKLDAAALSIGYTMSFDEMIKFLHAMLKGGIRKADGKFEVIRNWDNQLKRWKESQTDNEYQIALQERAKLASGEEIPSTIHCINDPNYVYVCNSLKSCPTLRQKLEAMIQEKFPQGWNSYGFMDTFNQWQDKQEFIDHFQRVKPCATAFDLSRLINPRSPMYMFKD